MTDCNELMSKLNQIEAKINALDDKYIPKSQRSAIVEDGANKGKQLAVAAILPTFGAYTLKTVTEQKFNTSFRKAVSASEEASNAFRQADLARVRAENALTKTQQLSRYVDDIVIRFNGAINNIQKFIRAIDNKASQALTKALDALGISRYARGLAGDALKLAGRALAKILSLLILIETIFSILNAIDLRNRMNALERRVGLIEREISSLISRIQRILNRVDGIEQLARSAKSIAENASNLAIQARSTANQAKAIGQSALSQATRAIAEIAIVSGVAIAASGLAGRALQTAQTALRRGSIPGPRGLPGLPGRNGLNGKNGLNGLRGRNGVNGKNGAPGRPITILQRITTPGRTTVIDNTRTVVVNRGGNTMNPADLALLRKIDATTTATRTRQNAHVGISTATNAVVVESRTFLTTMQNFAKKAWETTRIQKVLDALTFLAVMHNVSMLSRDVGETFFQLIGQGLQAVGIRDEEDNIIDVGQVIGSSVENFLRAILSDQVYEGVGVAWNKANRIISAASMIIWTVRSISDSSLDLMEWIGENTGRIGNALKRWGVVGERSYPWMSESAKAQSRYRNRFSKVTDALENTEDRLSVYMQATSAVIEVQEETQQLGESWQQFRSSVEEGIPDPWGDNVPVKAGYDANKAISDGPNVLPAESQKG